MDWNIDNLDKYLELTTKYCDNFKEWDSFKFKYSRETMCSWKFEVDFKTVEEYIKILEYAKNHNFRYLYQHTFRWMDENVWLENVIEKYNDDTFYAYVIYNNSKLYFLNLMIFKIENDLLKSILDNQIIKINYYFDNKDFFSQDEWYEYWENLSKDLKHKIRKVSEINHKIF